MSESVDQHGELQDHYVLLQEIQSLRLMSTGAHFNVNKDNRKTLSLIKIFFSVVHF